LRSAFAFSKSDTLVKYPFAKPNRGIGKAAQAAFPAI